MEATLSSRGARSFNELRRATRLYEGGRVHSSLWQITNSFAPFLAICAVMYWSLPRSYWITAALAPLAAGFVVRIFIIQHDCGHGAFFRSRAANDVVGVLCSLITLTPYRMWRRQHAGHHSHWNNLDRRSSGLDIYSTCLTVDEYRRLSASARLWRRTLQHPLVALVTLPPIVFLLLYRIPFDSPRGWGRERRSVHLTNAAVAGLIMSLGLTLGFGTVALVHAPVMAIAAIVGVWLFSIQHRFEQALWARQESWNPLCAALRGSSYLHLPRTLQWFAGNIGFHHVHHLNPKVPNYRLEACHLATPELQTAYVLRPEAALKAWRAALWDERAGRMVGFE